MSESPTEKKLREMVKTILDENINSLGFANDEDYFKAVDLFYEALVSVRNEAVNDAYRVLKEWEQTEKDIDITLLNLVLDLKTPEGKK